MAVALVVVLISLAVVLVAAVAWRRRFKDLESEGAEIVAAVGEALGRRPRSPAHAVAMLLDRDVEAGRRLDLVESTLAGSDIGLLIYDGSMNVVFATDLGRRLTEGRHGEAAAGLRIRTLAEKAIAECDVIDERVDLYELASRVLRVQVEPLPATGGGGAAVRLTDVTEQERVDAMRQDFVANVGHELKTPVGALAVLAEALQQTGDAATRSRLAGRLGEEAHRLAELVDDLLELSLLEQADSHVNDVDLRDVLTEARDRTQIHASAAGVAIRCELPDDPVVIPGDRPQLVSAVANLLDNAIKYGGLGPGAKEDVTLTLRRDGDRALIEVGDRGLGISESHQRRVFERFYRVDGARNRERGGTGLGLAIVRHVAINHGGTAEVTSKLGVGSTFRIVLPAEVS